MDITHDDRILLADHANISVKLFDQDGGYHASYVLANSPSDISAMSNDVAVEAFKSETPLLSLNIRDSIKIEQDIEGTSKVMYISCYQNRIVATYWDEPKSVKLIYINGHIYWSRSLTDKGQPLFKMPFYTSLYQDTGVFKIVILIDFSLTVKAATLIFISGLGSAISSAK